MSSRSRFQRGELWVIAQALLLLLILLAPQQISGLPALPETAAIYARIVGILLGVVGVLLALLGGRRLGENLTALPKPRADGALVQTGVYAHVRHPIYAGVVLAAFGWALVRTSTPALILAAVLWVFFELKARREERWLIGQFAEYAAYRERVRRRILL